MQTLRSRVPASHPCYNLRDAGGEMKPLEAPPRRHVLRALATVPLVPGALVAQTAPTAPTAAPSPTPAASPAEPSAAVEALTQAARHLFEPHLQPDQLDAVRKGIGASLRNGRELAALGLANSEEPVTVFHARPPAADERRPR
jgi:hypothetical protein